MNIDVANEYLDVLKSSITAIDAKMGTNQMTGSKELYTIKRKDAQKPQNSEAINSALNPFNTFVRKYVENELNAKISIYVNSDF